MSMHDPSIPQAMVPGDSKRPMGEADAGTARRRAGDGQGSDDTGDVLAMRSGHSAKRLLTLVIVVVVAVGVVWLARSGYYTSGSDVGYYLGLVGSLMMLSLLLYPLRKRVRWLSSLGRISRWFSVHMFFGVLGPVLILLHCTLRWSSLNAAVAFWCMVIVASSGVMGRFLYGRLHQGLYGRQLTLTEVRTDAASRLAKARQLLLSERAESILQVVLVFSAQASRVANAGWSNPVALMALGWRARRAQARSLRFARAPATFANPSPSRDAVDAAVQCIAIAQRSAQFLPFERLFSLWHVLHVPLVFILVLSVIAHVIAVHLY